MLSLAPRSFYFLLILFGAAGLRGAADLHVWSVYELELAASAEAAVPYVEGLNEGKPAHVTAEFQGVSGDASGRTLTVPGFWDGGRTWRVRFAPTAAGEWKYRTASMDAAMNGKTGSLQVRALTDDEKRANPTLHGSVHVASKGPNAGHYFEYADGTPMLWIGDTWWNWGRRGIKFEQWKKLVDDRSAKGFTVGQLFLGGEGWGKEASFLDATFSQPDLGHFREMERRIAYANSKGIVVWVHPWWFSSSEAKGRITNEAIRRWARYLVHRLQAYNVIWVLAGEYNVNNYADLGLDFWKGMGRLMDAEDPYNRVISAHPTPPTYEGGWDAPQWSTGDVMHDEPWLDYNQSQTGHARWTDELIPWVVKTNYERKPAKPIVVTEPSYEFVVDDPPAHIVRFAAWAAVLSGAAGHSYGGGQIWRAHTPETPAKVGPWPMDTNFETNTLEYPGARSIGFMARYLGAMQWWRLLPHPELVHEYAAPYCAADPGREYLAYFRFGGIAHLDLSAAPADATLEYRWTDLKAEKTYPAKTVSGGAIREIHPPYHPRLTEHRDWLLHVVRKAD